MKRARPSSRVGRLYFFQVRSAVPAMQQNAPESQNPVLQIEGLQVEFRTSRGLVRAVQNVSYDVMPGEWLPSLVKAAPANRLGPCRLGLLPKKTARIPRDV